MNVVGQEKRKSICFMARQRARSTALSLSLSLSSKKCVGRLGGAK